MERKTTQHDRIVKFTQINGSITPMEAFYRLGITKLSTRIGEIERSGLARFSRTMETAPTRYDDDARFMRYTLEWVKPEEESKEGEQE